MRRRKVDLVDARHDIEPGIHGKRRIRDGLCLDALRRIDDEHGSLASSKRARDLIGEVHVSRCIDQVEEIRLTVISVIHDAHGVRLDRDAALLLDVHGVKYLRGEVALLDRMGQLEDAVRYRRLAVVDVRDDGEIADMGGIYAHTSFMPCLGPAWLQHHLLRLSGQLWIFPDVRAHSSKVHVMARSRVCYTLVVDLAVSGCGTPLPTQREASSQSTERNRTVANIKSQKKRIKQAEKARVRNQAVRSELKTYVKKVREAVAASDAEAAQTAAYAANRKLDKAASKGVIHKNQAAQRKSGVQKLVNTLQK